MRPRLLVCVLAMSAFVCLGNGEPGSLGADRPLVPVSNGDVAITPQQQFAIPTMAGNAPAVYVPQTSQTGALVLAIPGTDGPTMVVYTVTAGESPPPPPPPPPPDPSSELAKKVKGWTVAIDKAERDPVLPKLASNFRGVAGGEHATVDVMFAELRRVNDPVLSGNAAWEPWAKAFVAEFEALWDAGKLDTVQQVATAFIEVAKGLEAAADVPTLSPARVGYIRPVRKEASKPS